MPTSPTPTDWWRTAVVYQIYPRSFADANGDGIGDLAGIRSRVPYLQALGVDAIWLSPFYPSPLADGGYDITDHRNVDPRLGTLTDFDALVADAHAADLRIIVDIVPNHTSEQHPWFQAALTAGPGSPERERFIFRPGSGPDGAEPPTDWCSHFGGPAWERTADGEWYCHLFAREQPDLNWDHPEVRADFERTLRFWADRGVDGFRVDVAHSLAKDLSVPLRSQPNLDTALPLDGTDPLYDRNEVHEIYRSWRRIFDSYDPPRMAVAETWTPASERTFLYARPDELGMVFDFSLLKARWDADEMRTVISRTITANTAVGGAMTWVLSNHDVPRAASRHALPVDVDLDSWLVGDGHAPAVDRALAERRVRAACLLLLSLPGSAYLYQGDELGLLEVADLPRSVLQDPVYERTSHTVKGRDGARVPIPWTADGPSLGFGAAEPWLPQPDWFANYAITVQDAEPSSVLSLYRSALTLRRTLDGEFSWLSSPTGVLRYVRGHDWEIIVNMSSAPVEVPDEGSIEVVLASQANAIREGLLAPDAAVWLRHRT